MIINFFWVILNIRSRFLQNPSYHQSTSLHMNKTEIRLTDIPSTLLFWSFGVKPFQRYELLIFVNQF